MSGTRSTGRFGDNLQRSAFYRPELDEGKKDLTALRSINAELKSRLELSEAQRSELQTKYEQSIKTVTSLEQPLQSWKDAGEKALAKAEARVAEADARLWKGVATGTSIAALIILAIAAVGSLAH